MALRKPKAVLIELLDRALHEAWRHRVHMDPRNNRLGCTHPEFREASVRQIRELVGAMRFLQEATLPPLKAQHYCFGVAAKHSSTGLPVKCKRRAKHKRPGGWYCSEHDPMRLLVLPGFARDLIR